MNESRKLEVTSHPRDVPAFGCVVYLTKSEQGIVGRVANLGLIEARGSSEREVLTSIVQQFKTRVAQYVREEETIPWIDPVPPPNDEEQKRFIPVHL